MSAEPTHEKFHGIHARRGNNVHERQVRDKDSHRLAESYAMACAQQSLSMMPSLVANIYNSYKQQQQSFLSSCITTTDAGDSITI